MLNAVIAVPAGYCELIYHCPESANFGWQYHEAHVDPGRNVPRPDARGDFYCYRCGERLFVDTVHKVPYTLRLIVVEEEL